ncbi:hypothetical protein LTR78_000552 [Recurvomyces mirabilis]|uniref:Uncharacterized protein n=1 Tax=Recurvomyces mirabilis TaxID=574656 RepID=A0AAE0WXH1_9PEZI|nr:hypothetical protein LTR78_000552 [Recurvomyces mirabilis]KAK5162206.1 hypothetical protein LTS14_000552 [Recurvomyces mirabilis]
MESYELRQTGEKGFEENNGAFYGNSRNRSDKEINHDATGMHSGTEADAVDMARLGRTQELRRNFKSLSVLGLSVTTMATWSALLLTNFFVMVNGGLAGAVWTYLASWIFTFALAASLAEMASMAPTSGGQYHWVSEFAPRSQQRFLSYITGWLAALGWQALIATTAYSAAVLILVMASIYHENYVPQNWHQSLLMILIGILATCMNTFGAKRLPLLEGLIFILHIFGWFAIIIVLWVLAPKTTSKDVFGTFSNFGGWSSIGTACYVGSITATGSFAGSDAAAHLSEETRDASKSVPRMIVGTVLINGAMGLVFIITYCYCITNIEALVNSTSPFPFIDVFLATTNSKVGTVCLIVIPMVLSVCTCLNALAAASRQAWALSRDNALPFSPWFRKVVVIGTPIPVNSIMFSLGILVIIALINIGSTAALNTIFALLTGATSFSYALSISCVMIKRLRREPLPPARFSLGKFGTPINMFAVAYVIVAAIASFFPVFNDPTATSMNWSILMFGGVFLIAVLDYAVRGRKHYVSPVQHVHKM